MSSESKSSDSSGPGLGAILSIFLVVSMTLLVGVAGCSFIAKSSSADEPDEAEAPAAEETSGE